VRNRTLIIPVAFGALIALGGGCNDPRWSLEAKGSSPEAPQAVPKPINLMLPKAVRIHPFTGTRTFDEAGGIKGLDVRAEVIDYYEDAAKAFGSFRFEMYHFIPNSTDPKGKRIATWDEDLLEPKKNLLHWDKITRTYEFKLQWTEAIPIGQRFVLEVTFTSPFTDRLFDQRVFISGQ
jgi:hypothetical protein